jgi:WD40 repeat protein
VATLQLLAGEQVAEGHDGEVFGCAFAPDDAFVLSAGWDGYLRLWEPASGAQVMSLQAGLKPLACCGFSPDGRQWLSGSMEGMLGVWDAVSHHSAMHFLAHTRPISAILYAPDGRQMATASWDRQVVLRKLGKEREGKILGGHRDIVAGCRYTPDGRQLLSWSHDGTLRLWDTESGRELHTFAGHDDRVTAGAVSPDGSWAASGGRDGVVKLWALTERTEAAAVKQATEVRGCFFLLDGESLLTVDAEGWLVLLSVPGLEVLAELGTGLKVMCADLSASGVQVALGCEDGHVHFAAVEGLEDAPLLVTVAQRTRQKASVLGRLLGKTRATAAYSYTCPACRRGAELGALPTGPFACPGCRRRLRPSSNVLQLQPAHTDAANLVKGRRKG